MPKQLEPPKPNATPNATYDVFLSYSRRDIEFVKLLETALNEHMPAAGQQRLSVFRDEGKITGNEYYRTIERTLRNSRKLILVASPNAYKSQFVNDEVRDFIRMKGARNVFVILYKGMPNNETPPGQEDQKAFPEVLCEVMRMPLAADYRGFDLAQNDLTTGRHLNDWRRVLEHLYSEEIALAAREAWDIFISYAAADAAFAGHLEKELEKYTPPKELAQEHNLPTRRLKVFRDEDDATRDDNDAIRRALESSQHMFLLCSPAARDDDRVKQQVARFAGLQGAERIVRVLVAGEPAPDVVGGAFPTELCRWIEEPAYTDYRGFKLGKDKLSNGTYSGHWATLLAMHYQINREELEQRERKRRVRNRQLIGGIVSVVILLLSVALILALVQRSEAIRQRQISESGLYVSRGLLAQAAMERRDYISANDFLEASFPAPGMPANEDLRSFDWFYRWRQLHDEKATLKGHSSSVWSVAFAPDGRTLASGSADKTVKLWDVASGQERATLKGHGARVWSVAFAPDGRTLASGSADMTVRLWEVASGRKLLEFKGHKDNVNSVAFAPDGRTLASGSWDGTVKLWEVASGRELRELKGHRALVTAVAFAPDGRTLASGSGDDAVKLWEVASGRELREFKGHSDGVSAVAFAPDGKTLASGSWDKAVKLWEVASGRKLRDFKGHSDDVSSVAFAPDGKTLASGSWNTGRPFLFGTDITIKLWEVASGRELRELKGHSARVSAVAFAPDGKTLASGSEDRTVKLWEVANGSELREFKGHNGSVSAVVFAPDGKALVSLSDDGSAKLWEVANGQERATLKGQEADVNAVAFAPDGRTVASGSEDKTVKLWEVASGRELREFKGHSDEVSAVAFAPDGRTLASGGADMTVRLWEVASGRELRELKGHSARVSAVAFAPDGKTLASGSEDKTVKLWEVANGSELREFKGHNGGVSAVVFAPDGKALVSLSDGESAKLWEVANGQERATLKGQEARVLSVAFAPDGRTVASGSGDGTVTLWSVTSGREQVTLRGHGASVSSVAFAPDGRTLASGSWDRTVKLWDVASGQERATLKGHGDSVVSVAFAPDGRTLASGGNGWVGADGKEIFPILLWRGATDAEVARDCIRCGRQ